YPGSENPSWILYNNIFSSLTLSIYPSYYGDLNQYRFYFVLKSTNSDNKLIIHLTYAKRSLRSILFFPVLFMKEETKYFWTISKEERIELYKEAIKDLNEKLSL
ncbi:MAG: hypothetical protein SFU98_12950, partial [Leptospiraceae bacterium]|nr:hypothetical protein [Leptospiraceae bacterium]